MKAYNKKQVLKSDVEQLCKKYKINPILASVFLRRNIKDGKDILFYLEDDLRFQHEPFCFDSMEDAVERITTAKEENEKILIFGDRDVDGITSTAILFGYLQEAGYDVQWRLPKDDDPYGLTIQAVDDFYAEGGSLIITVDCGICNYEEVRHANELGINVIVTDHHNPPEKLPDAIILDPKTEDSLYPFKDISGAAVAFKLVSALRFSKTPFFNAEICILEITENQNDKTFDVDCVKIKNLTCVKQLHEVIIPGKTSIYSLKLPSFLQGQVIYSWDSASTKQTLKNIFGNGVEFFINDLRNEISACMPLMKFKTTQDLSQNSKIGRYYESETSVIKSLFNLYVSYCHHMIAKNSQEQEKNKRMDLQLVGLAALADIMPMKDENRLFVKNCISSMKKDLPRPGLRELLPLLKLNYENICSTDLSWTLIPALNSTGRLGQPDIALKLLLSKDVKEREELAMQIIELNNKRKQLVSDTAFQIHDKAEKSIAEHQNKLCVVVEENINRGLTGLFAARLVTDFGVPGIAVTFQDDICIGSIRSNRGFISTDFLNSFGDDFFINHGGHNYAAGFSFKREKLDEFLAKITNSLPQINLETEADALEIDAEIPPQFFDADVFRLLDNFEPYGNENPELLFLTKGAKIADAQIIGKKEPFHLKLTLECGKLKLPALFWGQAERLKKDIAKDKICNILYTIKHNYFNGMVTNQLVIEDLEIVQ